ncbi:MAG: hypothetical protein V4633_13510 [Pseudomonadota bacterium]
MTIKTFMPKGDATVTIAVTVASASGTIDSNSSAVRIHNAGTALAFIRFSTGASTAVTTDMPIASGATETFTKGTANTISAIAESGTATLYVTNGEGL